MDVLDTVQAMNSLALQYHSILSYDQRRCTIKNDLAMCRNIWWQAETLHIECPLKPRIQLGDDRLIRCNVI